MEGEGRGWRGGVKEWEGWGDFRWGGSDGEVWIGRL